MRKYNTNANIIRVIENLYDKAQRKNLWFCSFVGLKIFISTDTTYTKHRHGRISRIRTGSVNAYLVLLLCHVKMKVVIVHATILYRIVIVAMRMIMHCFPWRQMQVVIFIPNYLTEAKIRTSSPKSNDRSPESNVPRSNLISKTYKWAMETRGPKSNSSELLCLSWLPATLMTIWSKMNELACRHHFPIISLWEIF